MRETPKAQDATEAKMLEISTMDNPQLTVAEIAWLAGIWDGEGTISVRRNLRINQFSPRISMVNTNAAILRRTADILEKANVSFAIHEKGVGGFPGSRKQCWIISVETLANSAKLLDLLMPYLVGKIEQARLMKRFIDSRLRRIAKVKRMNDTPYSREELKALIDVTDLNGNQRGSSETIRASLAALDAQLSMI